MMNPQCYFKGMLATLKNPDRYIFINHVIKNTNLFITNKED